MKILNICVIADQLYKSGGIERVISHKVRYWHSQGHKISIITHENSFNNFYYNIPTSVNTKDLSINYNRNFPLTSATNIFKAIKHFFKLSILIRKIKPDIVIVTNYSYEYYFFSILKSYFKLIKENHSSCFKLNTQLTKFQKAKAIIHKIFQCRYNNHIFLSLEEADCAGVKNGIVIPNPIQTLKKEIEMDGFFYRNNVILSAGRIAPVKGFDRLIDVWALIAKHVPDWKIEIYGDGEINYIEELNHKISKNNLQDSFSLNPSTTDILDKMLESKIYAMTSLTECFPMVLLEAMQSFLPIVSFDCPTGPRNIIKHNETGILVSNGDIEAFASSLLLLINSEEKRMQLAKMAYQESKKYELENVMQQWDSLFDKLMRS